MGVDVKRMKSWVGVQAAKIAAALLKKIGPGIIAHLLAQIDPEAIAAQVRPHMEAVMYSMPVELRSSYVAALRKLVDIAVACIPTGGERK